MIDYAKYPLPKKVRHHTSSNLYMPASELRTIPEHYPPIIKDINWADVFGNGRRPDELDIGCGKGSFLIELALKRPGINILGIEIRHALVDWINGVARGESIDNCGALWYTVVNGLDFIGERSIRAAYYLFPDPWPKTRHLRRRAFQEPFLKDLSRVLVPGGRLYLATDVDYVHEHHLAVLESSQLFDWQVVSQPEDWNLPVTNKERFCILHDIETYRIIATPRA
ncbi:MAG: tRNA (guanine(46)-N(7))-methyltransferase TrmB [Chloroflexota bacterium]